MRILILVILAALLALLALPGPAGARSDEIEFRPYAPMKPLPAPDPFTVRPWVEIEWRKDTAFKPYVQAEPFRPLSRLEVQPYRPYNPPF